MLVSSAKGLRRPAAAAARSLLIRHDSVRLFTEDIAEEPIPDEGEWAGCRRSFMNPLQISVKGSDVLTDPLFNKGTAFKSGERDRLKIRGLLPPRVMNIRKLIDWPLTFAILGQKLISSRLFSFGRYPKGPLPGSTSSRAK